MVCSLVYLMVVFMFLVPCLPLVMFAVSVQFWLGILHFPPFLVEIPHIEGKGVVLSMEEMILHPLDSKKYFHWYRS